MRASRSMLYIPGDSPKMIQNSPYFGADSILLDLEDAIAMAEKDSARRVVSTFLRNFDFGDLTVIVRINGADTEFFEDDIKEIIPCRPYAVRIPKCSSPDDVLLADRKIAECEEKNGIPVGTVKIHAMIETALGLERAFAIASACPRVGALTIGGQDFTADMGVQKTKEGTELFYARCRIVAAAHAAGVEAYDTVWADIDDPEGLYKESRQIVTLGFTGKACIHPSQIEMIHKAFQPAEKELRKALKIVAAAKEAEENGKGVIAVDGKIVDAPIVARSQHLLELAKMYGMELEEAAQI